MTPSRDNRLLHFDDLLHFDGFMKVPDGFIKF